ncbi:hypothetical protein HK104_007720 [Borealophlyctis nickersoniae]|nr:hypothetical protein HK104_007720 [Borealophlyctis nickersoniae]
MNPDDRLCCGHYNFLNELARSARKARDIEAYLARPKRKVAVGRVKAGADAPEQAAEATSGATVAKKAGSAAAARNGVSRVPSDPSLKKKAAEDKRLSAGVTGAEAKRRSAPAKRPTSAKKPATEKDVRSTPPSNKTPTQKSTPSTKRNSARSPLPSPPDGHPTPSPSPSPIPSTTSEPSSRPTSAVPSLSVSAPSAATTPVPDQTQLEQPEQTSQSVDGSSRPSAAPARSRVSSLVGIFGSFRATRPTPDDDSADDAPKSAPLFAAAETAPTQRENKELQVDMAEIAELKQSYQQAMSDLTSQVVSLESRLTAAQEATRAAEKTAEDLKSDLKEMKDQKDVLLQVSEELTQEMVVMKMGTKEQVKRAQDEIRKEMIAQAKMYKEREEAIHIVRDQEAAELRTQLDTAVESLQSTSTLLTQNQAALQSIQQDRDDLLQAHKAQQSANATLRADLDRSEATRVDLEMRLTTSTTASEALQSEHNKLRVELERSRSNCKDLETRLTSTVSAYEALQSEHSALRADLDRSESTRMDLESRLASFNSSYDALQSTNTTLRTSLDRAESTTADLQTRLASTISAYQTLEATNTALRTDLDRSESTRMDLQTRLTSAIADAHTSGDQRVSEVTQRLSKVEDERQTLAQELKELKRVHKEAEATWMGLVQEAKEGKAKVEKEVEETVRNQNLEIERLVKEAEEEKNKLHDQFEEEKSNLKKELENHVRNKEREIDGLQKNVARLEAEIEKTDSVLAKQKTDFLTHIEQIEEHTAVQRGEWERDLAEARTALSNALNDLASLRDASAAETEALKTQLEEAEARRREEVERIEGELKSVRDELKSVKAQRDGEVKKCEGLESALETLMKDVDDKAKELEEKVREMEALKEPLVKELKAVMEEKVVLEEKVKELESNLATSLASHESASSEHPSLLAAQTSELDRLKSELTAVTSTLDDTKGELAAVQIALQTAAARGDELQRSLDRVTAELGDAKEEKEEKEEKIQEAVVAIEEREKRIAELEKKLEKLGRPTSLMERASFEEAIRQTCATEEGRNWLAKILPVEHQSVLCKSPSPEDQPVDGVIAKGRNLDGISRRAATIQDMRPPGSPSEIKLDRLGHRISPLEFLASRSSSAPPNRHSSPPTVGDDLTVGAGGMLAEVMSDVQAKRRSTYMHTPIAVRPDVQGQSGPSSPETSPASASSFNPNLFMYEATGRLCPEFPRHHFLTHLYLDHCSLGAIPVTMWMDTPKLLVLDLSGNALSVLPRQIVALRDLRELYLAENNLTEVPVEVEGLVKLEVLDLAKNEIGGLPSGIFARMHRLEHVDLSSNKLHVLPPSLGLLSDRLLSLFIESNPFDPSWKHLLEDYLQLTAEPPRPFATSQDVAIANDARTAARIASVRKRWMGMNGYEEGVNGNVREKVKRGTASLRSTASSESLSSIVTSSVAGWNDDEAVKMRVTSIDSGVSDLSKIGRVVPMKRDGSSSAGSDLAAQIASKLQTELAHEGYLPNIRRRSIPPGGRIHLLRILSHLRDKYDLELKFHRSASQIMSSMDDARSFIGSIGGRRSPVSFHESEVEGSDTTSDNAPPKKESPPATAEDLERLRQKQEERRRKIVAEIVFTEQTYVKQLQALVDIYVSKLEQGDLLSQHDCAAIFGNVKSILKVHEQLLPDIEEAAKQPYQRIGQVFMDIAPFLKMYSQYYNNFETANSYVSQLEILCGLSSTHSRSTVLPHGQHSPIASLATGKKAAIKKLRQFLKASKTHPSHSQINLQAFLILPVQRLPRYRMLLEQLLDATPKEHPDYMQLKMAAAQIRRRVEECNENKRDAEEHNKGLGVISRIKVVDGMSKNVERLRHFSVGRKFLREGFVRVVKYVEPYTEGAAVGPDIGRRMDPLFVCSGKKTFMQLLVGGLFETRIGEGAETASGKTVSLTSGVSGGAAVYGVGRLAGREFRLILFSDVLCWVKAESAAPSPSQSQQQQAASLSSSSSSSISSSAASINGSSSSSISSSSGGGAGGGPELTYHELIRTFSVGTGRRAELMEVAGGEGGREGIMRVGDSDCVMYVRGAWEDMAGWVRMINGGR